VVATPMRWGAFIMKKIILAALTVILALSLTACAREKQDISEIVGEDVQLTGEITVSYYSKSYEKFLNGAAELFEQQYPGTKINIVSFSKMPEQTIVDVGGKPVVFSEDPDAQEIIDYINRVSTQLMSGQGPDILAMDVLPYYKYISSGSLDDLRLYMEADQSFDISAYRSNIFNSIMYKGGQYIMPLDFSYLFVTFDKSKLNEAAANKLREKNTFTYQELIDLIKDQFAQDGSNARVIDFYDMQWALIRMFFEPEYKKYVDLENKIAHFADGGFAQLLNELYEQRENGYFKPKLLSLEEQARDIVDNGRFYYYNIETIGTLKSIFKLDLRDKDWFYAPDADEIAGLIINSAGEAVFNCIQAYGINANSKNKALAWAFIKFMLSEEMQQSIFLYGNPINNAAFIEDAKVDLIKIPNDADWKPSDYMYEFLEQERTEEKYLRAYEDFLEWHTGFSDELSYCPVTDRVIRIMVEKEVEEFFSGRKSAEMVADTLQNKVSLYLNE
jgi:ABC-type glycerol-3-phosphate transport system substrate-binding protein